jgi:FAD/FMN-containing dehydrogenase
MNRSKRVFLKQAFFVILLGMVSFVLSMAKKVFDYSLPPAKEKDCDFVYPKDEENGRLSSIAAESTERPFNLEQAGGFINDASCLNKTAIYGIVKVKSAEDIRNALQFGRENHLRVTVAGQRHSMGGQSFIEEGLVIDMRNFSRINLNKDTKVLTAQSGATWAQIQPLLDREGYSVLAMQSINVPTVGGTLSVNAHGIAHSPGQIAPTVRSLRIMLSDGEVVTASPTQNPDLFRLALGGYGLFGVILEADLEVVANEVYEWKTQYMNYKDFTEFYRKNVEGNQRIGLAYGRLSVSPSSYLTETAFHTYERRNFEGPIPALKQVGHDWFVRLVLNFSKTGGLGRRVRWNLEKYVEPKIYPCLSRNQAMVQGEGCLVTRNEEMNDSMDYLKSRMRDTNILQEYFIPQERMAEFVDGLRKVVSENNANLLNVTIRIVHKDIITALPYAKQDMFAFVLYLNQKLNEADSKRIEKTTSELIDLALRLNGAFYLPYQLYYSRGQLRRAYPEIDDFFAQKKRYDPIGLFTNKFYEKYKNETSAAR